MNRLIQKQLWYTKRNQEVRGPFPAAQIGQYLILGRLKLLDEVSVDQQRWISLHHLPELIPEELSANPDDPQAMERLHLARQRADERTGRDRRDGKPAGEFAERRSGQERRESEQQVAVQRRRLRQQLLRKESGGSVSRWRVVAGLVMVCGLLFLFAKSFKATAPWESFIIANCAMPAGPRINWSGCDKVGVRLDHSDLTLAKASGANFMGSDLEASRFYQTDLQGANLRRARLSASIVQESSLEGVDLREADLSATVLQAVNLHSASLQGVNLQQARLTDVDLREADLTGAHLEQAILDNVRLDGAVWVDGRRCAVGSLGRCL